MRWLWGSIAIVVVLWVSGIAYTNAGVFEYYAKAPVIRTMYCQGVLKAVTLHDPSGKTIWRGMPGDDMDVRSALDKFRDMLTEMYGMEPFESLTMFPAAACEEVSA